MTFNDPHACEPPRRVLAAIDGGPAARGAAAQAVALARACGAQLRFLHVADPRLLLGKVPLHEAGSDAMARQLAEGQRLVDEAVAQARTAGVAADGVVRRDAPQRVCDLVLREATDWRADLVVIGSHGRHGLSRLAMGSEAEAVMRHCEVPVLVVKA
jgi:nucleotide-binding universal stress UspA family protein